MKYVLASSLTMAFLGTQTLAQENPYFLQKLSSLSSYSVEQLASSSGYQAESVCGVDDLQHVELYDNRYANLGFNYNFVNLASASVGILHSGNNVETGFRYCSGTLIGEDLFLTASHCVGNTTTTHFVTFGFQNDVNIQDVNDDNFRTFAIRNIVEDGANTGQLDYAILELVGVPSETEIEIPLSNHPRLIHRKKSALLSWKPVDERLPDDILIIQHPNGEAKQIDAGSGITQDGTRIRYSDIDTHPGSSGSGLINAQGQLVGVHTNGGCRATTGSNFGVSMNSILAVSGVLNTPQFNHDFVSWHGTENQVEVGRFGIQGLDLWGEGSYTQETADAYCDFLGFANGAQSFETNACGEDESSFYRYNPHSNTWESKESGSRNRCYALMSQVQCN